MSDQLSNTAPQTVATAAASPRKTFEELVTSDKFKSQIALALPRHLTPERFLRVLMTATMKNPQLLECTQESMFKGIFDCAAAGLELDGRRAHLVPLRNTKKAGSPLEANLWLDYKGIAELVMRSGVVSNIHADTVCENDVFQYDRGELKRHSIDFRKPRGDIYAAYCIIRMRDGGEKVEVMGKDEIDRIRNGSMGKNASPWTQHYGEQAKKTVFKRASKWVPLSPETRDVVEKEDDAIDVESSMGSQGQLTDGGQSKIDRPEPPPRKPRGSRAVTSEVVVEQASKDSAAAMAKQMGDTIRADNPDHPSNAQPPADDAHVAPGATLFSDPAKTAPAMPKLTLKGGEKFEGVVTVVDPGAFFIGIAGVPTSSVKALVEGDYKGIVYGKGFGVLVDNKPALPPHWQKGSVLKVMLSGFLNRKMIDPETKKPYPDGVLQTYVESAVAVVPQEEMMEG